MSALRKAIERERAAYKAYERASEYHSFECSFPGYDATIVARTADDADMAFSLWQEANDAMLSAYDDAHHMSRFGTPRTKD